MNKTRLYNCLLLFFSLAIATTIAEFAARVMLDDITTTADNRSYFALRWKQAHVQLNEFGYRGHDFEPSKPNGIFRIALIGDSYTFGQGIPESERMSDLLEADLRKAGRQVEVLNFGNPGNNTANEGRVLQNVLENFDPDFILLQWFVNDVENNRPVPTSSQISQATPSRLNQFKMWMRNKSALYFLAAETWHRMLGKIGAGYTEELERRVGEVTSPEWIAAEESLTEFIRNCRARNVRMGIVLVPYLAPFSDDGYPFAFLHERVLGICAREGVPCVDLLDEFAGYLADEKKYQSLWVNRFDSHMGSAANRIAEARLLEAFGSQWTNDAGH